MPRPVAAPQKIVTRAGNLLTSATVFENVDRLLDGVAFRPDSNDAGGIIDVCASDEKTIATPLGEIVVEPFGFYVGDQCSTLTGPDIIRDTLERVRTRLDYRTSNFVEQAFWTGAPRTVPIATGTGTALATQDADDVTPGTGPLDIVPAVSLLIEELNDALGGTRGIIHVPQESLPYLEFYGQVVRQGNFLQVAGTDHLVVAGTGYPGTDPDGTAAAAGETWWYATGQVNVELSAIRAPGEDNPASLVDRSVNTVQVRAERVAVAYFDPAAHIALNVCLPNPGPGCETS